MANVAAKLLPVIQRFKIPVNVYVRADAALLSPDPNPTLPNEGIPANPPLQPALPPISVPCPCTKNPWKSYNFKWHEEHPDAPSCGGTGFLINDEMPRLDLHPIDAVVIPNYGATGTEFAGLLPSQKYDWEWMAITQDTTKFEFLTFTDDIGDVYTFKVENKMPYYIEKSLTPAVIVYTLIPVKAG